MNNTGDPNTQDIGLIYMNARYYVPEVGRFVSPDTIVPDPTNPQSFNRYSYVLNSPPNFTDPSGHKECIDSAGGECLVTLPHATNKQIDMVSAWIYYQDNFNLPFEGNKPITQDFQSGSGGHNGVDFGGEFGVQSPAGGIVTFAGTSSGAGAGIWKIQNNGTGEVREWSQFCDGPPPACNPPLGSASNATNGPLDLLASGEWTDIEPGWSHTQGTKIVIDHEHDLKSIYYHVAVTVSPELVVDQGTPLGTTANIGWSTGTHLHYSLVWEYQGTSTYLNPLGPPASISHLLD